MAATGEKIGDSNGDWQEVRRRKPYPNNWRQSQPAQPKASPYQPYSKPTYAQVVRFSPPANTMTSQRQHSPASTQPTSPTSQTSSAFYVSPHSPSRLRFPPSHTFPEWRGRCFRCCRTGHSAAKCRNPKRCGKCWSFGHIGSKCKQDIVAPPMPVRPSNKPHTHVPSEPKFDKLLNGAFPYRTPEMPKERPLRLHCFIARDAEYFAELERLKQAVVMHTGVSQWEFSADIVCDFACSTKLVTKEEIKVSELSGSRFLIMLPEGLDPDTFINATPQSAWDEGLSFQPWTPLEDAAISIPAYKILLSLVGIPPHLFNEKHVAQAVCHFGVFLGSVAPERSSSLAAWTVAVGVDDLTLVPPELVMHVGGMVHTIKVHILAYHRAPIYTADEMPKYPKTYSRPQPPPSSSSSSDNEFMQDDLELIPMSTRVLRDICRGRTADSLPPELRRFAMIEEKELDYTYMATHDDATPDQLAIPDPEAQNQDVSQNDQPVIQQSKDRELLNSASKDGTGQQPVSLHQPPHQGAQASKPQTILLRWESSNINSAAVTSLYGGTDPAGIKRTILSGFLKTSNNDASKIRGNNGGSNQGVIITENACPKSSDLPINEHRSQPQKPGIIFQDKGKGRIAGPVNCGPITRKFKWTRPVTNSSQVTKKIIEASSQKRKNPTKLPARPTKKKSGKGKEKEHAEVSFNSEGFYEVKVHYDHVSKLAAGCGFTNRDVEKIINTDNAQRQIEATQQSNTETAIIDEEDPDLSRFELDPNDELTSEEEDA